ncbi:MAG TPA: F0F1 ATP synthase subunit A [Candidatus Avoscillospira avicola]|uniref:F0F1 ATP synthase subunit A n=1 Tax=Candidatus Avoscillospira avicola TaxID=2840706 RepID=A0A9D1DH31_9FIRM|nr:F0F1 ATP synthase subunit A [Candidatus Avoscillospira avicola]
MTTRLILAGVGAVIALAGWLWRRDALARWAAAPAPEGAKPKKKPRLPTVVMLLGLWLLIVKVLELAFGVKERGSFNVEIWAERVDVGGFSLSMTVVYTWIIMAALTLVAVILRLTVIPRMQETPKGAQNVLEIMVENLVKYTKSNVGDLGNNLPAYLFTVAAFMVGSAILELFGVRAPTSDITMTFSMALITFVLINYYGLKVKGVGGRLKRYRNPMNLVSDLAIPVSLACRLFGNMLGGLIVMDLLYFAMGSYAVAVPSVVGLYFNVFHPLIQAFIFVTLTLTFIGEAVE